MSPKARERRFRMIYDMGCAVCFIEGWPHEPCQIQHLVDEGNRELSGGDAATIGLCPWHHMGLPANGASLKQMYVMRGPSLRLSSKEFNERWPQRRLLQLVNNKLAEREASLISRAS